VTGSNAILATFDHAPKALAIWTASSALTAPVTAAVFSPWA